MKKSSSERLGDWPLSTHLVKGLAQYLGRWLLRTRGFGVINVPLTVFGTRQELNKWQFLVMLVWNYAEDVGCLLRECVCSSIFPWRTWGTRAIKKNTAVAHMKPPQNLD